MKKLEYRSGILFSSIFIALVFVCAFVAVSSARDSLSPNLNKGMKWRIGYYEGGPWQDYQVNLIVTLKGLMKLGWIEKQGFPALPNRDDTKALWKWLSGDLRSKYLDFVTDAYWSSGWNEEVRKINRADCLDRLKRKDLDAILALGTYAGQDLVNEEHEVSTVVMSTTDPIRSGIIKSPYDSGYDHVLVRCDPTRYLRQIKLYHDIFRFKRLGVVYENTPEGISFANLGDLRTVGDERGFKILECIAKDKNLSLNEAIEEFTDCCKKLAPNIDAFYFTDHRGAHIDELSRPLEPLLSYRVPTWSNRGSVLVKHGVLMSIARDNLDHLGVFYSRVLARIFNGARPRSLNQIHKEHFKLAINLDTARRIGYKVPRNVLSVANILYDKTE